MQKCSGRKNKKLIIQGWSSMELIEDKISFEYYKQHCYDSKLNARNFGCEHNNVRYGVDMYAAWFGVSRELDGEKRIISYIESNGKVRFKEILKETVQYMAGIDKYFERMLSYSYSTERQFRIYSEQEYQKEMEYLENHKSQNKGDVFRDLKFIRNGCTYHMSVNVNICQQMLYCCDIVPDKELKFWYFELKKFPIYESAFDEEYKKRCVKIKNLTTEELYNRYNERRKMNQKQSKKQSQERKTYKRDEVVAEIAKRRARGICDLADDNGQFHEAPFKVEGEPFLESHHVTWLSKGGEDDINNVVALCPNCHRKIHILQEAVDEKKLKKRLEGYNKLFSSIKNKSEADK